VHEWQNTDVCKHSLVVKHSSDKTGHQSNWATQIACQLEIKNQQISKFGELDCINVKKQTNKQTKKQYKS